MGVVNCEKHGRTGMVFNCSHLSEKVWDFKNISEFIKRVEKKKNHKIGFDETYFLCRNCDKEYKEIRFSSLPDALTIPVCAKCFIELSDLED